MNYLWPAIILIAIALAAFTTSADANGMQAVTDALFASAKSSVNLAIGLVGAMAFFLGLMKILEEAGAMRGIARLLKPLMTRLFPEVPTDHPAMSAMILNMSANILGLGNAATPFGIKAMQELDTLSKEKGTATDAMCLFLAINTSSVTLLPTGVIAIRAAEEVGSKDPAGILIPTLFATLVSTSVAILAAKLFQASGFYAYGPQQAEQNRWASLLRVAPILVVLSLLMTGVVGMVLFLRGYSEQIAAVVGVITPWLIPVIVAGPLIAGLILRVKVYEVFVEGAKEGFEVALKIIPYLVAILCAVGMLRASGGIDLITNVLGPITALIGMPAEALPMALLRPLSGSGALGVMIETMKTVGPDSLAGYMVSTFQGTTETTFYVLAVYFGAAGVSRTRWALPAALSADVAGILAAVLICNVLFA